MMQAVLGRVFRQAGVQLKGLVEGVATQAVLDSTEAGVSGSFTGLRSESSGSRMGGQYVQMTSVQSPISNSNLVFIREAATGTGIALTSVSVAGVWT